MPVPGRIQRGILQAEVSGEVHHHADMLFDVGHEVLRFPVRQGEEHDVETVEVGRLCGPEREGWIGGGQRWRVGADRLSGGRTGPGHHHLEFGVGGAQA